MCTFKDDRLLRVDPEKYLTLHSVSNSRMAQPGTVLITGCSDGGSGSALATLFQQNGYRVFATARDIKKMSKLESLHNVRLLTLDVVNREQIQAAVEIVSKETGGTLTYLINNAAQNHYMPMLDEDIETAKQIFDVNVWGPLAVAQAFAPLVIKAKGTMVFVSSVAGCLNVPYQGMNLAIYIDLTHVYQIYASIPEIYSL